MKAIFVTNSQIFSLTFFRGPGRMLQQMSRAFLPRAHPPQADSGQTRTPLFLLAALTASKVSGPRPGGVDADRTLQHALQSPAQAPRLGEHCPGVYPLKGG